MTRAILHSRVSSVRKLPHRTQAEYVGRRIHDVQRLWVCRIANLEKACDLRVSPTTGQRHCPAADLSQLFVTGYSRFVNAPMSGQVSIADLDGGRFFGPGSSGGRFDNRRRVGRRGSWGGGTGYIDARSLSVARGYAFRQRVNTVGPRNRSVPADIPRDMAAIRVRSFPPDRNRRFQRRAPDVARPPLVGVARPTARPTGGGHRGEA
jgi:hypothetical protein